MGPPTSFGTPQFCDLRRIVTRCSSFLAESLAVERIPHTVVSSARCHNSVRRCSAKRHNEAGMFDRAEQQVLDSIIKSAALSLSSRTPLAATPVFEHDAA